MESPLSDEPQICSNETCKDDNTLGGRIAFTLLFVHVLFLLSKNIQNIRNIIKQKRKINIQKLLTINILILVFLICSSVYYADGIVSFFTKNGFQTFTTLNTNMAFNMSCLQIIFTVGYYNWSALFATVYEKPKKLVTTIATIILIFFCLLFTASFVGLAIIFTMFEGDDNLRNNQYYHICMTVLSASVIANSSLFALFCKILVDKLGVFYFFSSEEIAKKMKKLLYCTLIASCLRVIHNITFNVIGVPQYVELKESIYNNTATQMQQVYWFLYMFGFFTVCNLVPIQFMLTNFSPMVIRNNTVQSYNSDHSSDTEAKLLPDDKSSHHKSGRLST